MMTTIANKQMNEPKVEENKNRSNILQYIYRSARAAAYNSRVLMLIEYDVSTRKPPSHHAYFHCYSFV